MKRSPVAKASLTEVIRFKELLNKQLEKITNDKHHVFVDVNFNEDYKKYIPEGWYGFDIGILLPKSIYEGIKNITDFLITNYPDVNILQVKWKFNRLRYYTENIPIPIDNLLLRFGDKVYFKT